MPAEVYAGDRSRSRVGRTGPRCILRGWKRCWKTWHEPAVLAGVSPASCRRPGVLIAAPCTPG